MNIAHMVKSGQLRAKLKLGQVGVDSNIAQNHSSSPQEVISGPQFTWKVDQKLNYVKLESISTLLRITQLAYRKSYLVIMCPNAHEQLTKSEIMSSWSRFEYCSKSLVQPIGSHIWQLLAPINMNSWPNMKLGQVIINCNLVLSTFI